MSDTILGGDFTVYYLAENRRKQIKYTGAGTTYTVRALYSALQDLFGYGNQMDDGIPIKYQTPTEYTVGKIDAGDNDPWFIDKKSVEYLKGGAIQTTGWARVEASNTGIVRVQCDSSGFTITESDIGENIHDITNGDQGVLLDVNEETQELWIRPDDNTSANSFDGDGAALQVTDSSSGADATQDGASETGETLWANVYSIGTIANNTFLYINQNGANVTEYKDATVAWWEAGHIDILIPVKEVNTEIDEGVIQVFARQYSKSYAYFELDLTAGGRNPIPLQTGSDINNESGYRSVNVSGAGGDFTVGEKVTGGTNGGEVIVTAVTGSPTTAFEYYIVGNLDMPDLIDTETLTGSIVGSNGTVSGAPSNAGPALLSGLSIAHGWDSTFDIDEDGTNEDYSTVIDVSEESLADAYQWCKYITSRGETGTGNTDGLEAEFFIGPDYKLSYVTLDGSIAEGAVVVQSTTGATGTVVAHNTTDKYLIVRNTRGTFLSGDSGYDVEVDSNNEINTITVSIWTPRADAIFGYFAGGTWFLHYGVVLKNVPSADSNNYKATGDDGSVYEAPTKVTVLVGNTRDGDFVAVYELDVNGNIDKDAYTVDATQGAAGAVTLKVDPNILAKVPGKTTGGRIVLVDTDAEEEYVPRYTSWATDVFTLFTQASTTMDTGTSTSIIDTGAFTNCEVGDLIRNTDRGNAISYIVNKVPNDEVEIYPPISGQTNGDAYDVGLVPIAGDTSDTVYVPYIHVYETYGSDDDTGEESVSVTYPGSAISVRVVARQAGGIVPYSTDTQITANGMNNSIIRTADTVYQ